MSEPRYLARSWWADPSWARGGAQLVDDDLHRLGNVCHYPGRASAFGIMTLANLRANLRGWWTYHVKTRGWADIGYQACVSMTTEGPVVVDLRGIGRVPAAHASASNPRANWHGGATLWTIGNTETPHPELIEAYRHFRTHVWLPRWPTAKGVTHHRRVPGAQTSCAGDKMDLLVRAGTLAQPWTGDDDMPNLDEIRDEVRKVVQQELARQYTHDGPPATTVSTRHGGRYGYLATQAAGRIEAKLNVVIKALSEHDSTIAARVAAAVERADAEAVAELLEIDVKETPPAG
jgi:hypothetical protein